MVAQRSVLQLTLPSKRVLSYVEYNVATGTPVLFFHGFPNSRLDWRLFYDEISN